MGFALDVKIVKVGQDNLGLVRAYSEAKIGRGYYSDRFYQRLLEGPYGQASYCLMDSRGNIRGMRLTLGPGQWLDDFEDRPLGVRQRFPRYEKLAYFKTIYVDSDLTGQGLGGQLSRKSLEFLKSTDCLGVVTHSVINFSPHGSSEKYLKKLGFVPLVDHPSYWKHIPNLHCHICDSEPCACDAREMLLDFSKGGMG